MLWTYLDASFIDPRTPGLPEPIAAAATEARQSKERLAEARRAVGELRGALRTTRDPDERSETEAQLDAALRRVEECDRAVRENLMAQAAAVASHKEEWREAQEKRLDQQRARATNLLTELADALHLVDEGSLLLRAIHRSNGHPEGWNYRPANRDRITAGVEKAIAQDRKRPRKNGAVPRDRNSLLAAISSEAAG